MIVILIVAMINVVVIFYTLAVKKLEGKANDLKSSMICTLSTTHSLLYIFVDQTELIVCHIRWKAPVSLFL